MNQTTYTDGRTVNTYYESLEDANKAALSDLSRDDVRAVKTTRLTETEAKYRPCPCGSGKKYKFCCGK